MVWRRVCLPNFGDEKGIAMSLRLSELTCRFFVQGFPGMTSDQFGLERRRDAALREQISVWQLKMRQYARITFSLDTGSHSCDQSEALQETPRVSVDVRVVRDSTGRIRRVGCQTKRDSTPRGYSRKVAGKRQNQCNTIDLSECIW